MSIITERNDEHDTAVRLLQQPGVVTLMQARHHDVRALHQPYRWRHHTAQRLDRAHPRPGDIDHATRHHRGLSCGVAHGAAPAVAIGHDPDQRAAGPHAGAQRLRVDQCAQREPCIVHPQIVIGVCGADSRLQPAQQGKAGRQPLRSRQAGTAGQQIVQRQTGRQHPRRSLTGMRHDEALRTHQMRRDAAQCFALLQGFPHQTEGALFEVTQSAVNELGRGRRGSPGDIAAIADDDVEAAQCGIACDAGAIDAGTDNEQVTAIPGHGRILRPGRQKQKGTP